MWLAQETVTADQAKAMIAVAVKRERDRSFGITLDILRVVVRPSAKPSTTGDKTRRVLMSSAIQNKESLNDLGATR